MAFGKVTKQDLIDAGLDPDKLKDFQDKGVTKDDLATLKTELATSVTDLIKAQFTELETKLRTPTTTTRTEPDNIDRNRQQTAEEIAEAEQLEYATDPVNFVKKQTGRLGAAAAIEFKTMSRNMAYENLSGKLKGFRNSTIKAEIDEEWKKYTPEMLVRNGGDPLTVLQQVHDMVIGKHHEEIMQDHNKKDGKFNLIHSGTSTSTAGGSDRTEDSDNKGKLSAAEIAQAKKFGMTEDEWRKQDEDMEKEELERRRLPVSA